MNDPDALRLALLHQDLVAVDRALADGASLSDPVGGHAVLPLMLRGMRADGTARAAIRALIEPLIDRGADPNATDDQGRSVLHLAALEQEWDTVLTVGRRGGRFLGTLPDGHHGEALDHATSALRADVMACLVTAGHPVPTATSRNGLGFSLLHLWATAIVVVPPAQEMAVLDLLLAWGLPLDAQHMVTQMTPLFSAVRSNRPLRAQALLDRRANPDLGAIQTVTPGLSARNYTPLHLASARNQVAMVDRLLAAGASPTATAWLGDSSHGAITPLSEARQHHAHEALVRLETVLLNDPTLVLDDRPSPRPARARL